RNQVESKVAIFQAEYESYEKGKATMTEEIKKKKEMNINRLQAEIENIQVEYQGLMANKQAELVTPIREKIQQKIDEIAREQKYDYVLNNHVGPELDIVLYGKPELDITNL